MFTAYDKAHHTQYALYEQYATLAPGAESFRVAETIKHTTSNDDAFLHTLNREILPALKREQNTIAEEYSLFAIHNKDFTAYDVYLLDEDRRFIAVTPNVSQADILTVASSIMNR